MGNIPETVFRPLASSVVGTLGVDTSGERIGQSIAGAGEAIANRLITKAARRKQTLDVVDAEARVRKYEAEIDLEQSNMRSNFQGDPRVGAEANAVFNETALNNSLQDIKDDNVRALFAQKASTVSRRKGREANAWAHQQEVINASIDFSAITDTNASQLKLNPDLALLGQRVAENNSKAREQSAKAIYGKNWQVAIRKGNESMVRGTLAGLEATDPTRGLQLIRSGKLNKYFDGDDLKKLEKNMTDSIEGWKERQHLEEQLEVFDFFTGADKLFNEGKLNTDEVDKLEIGLEAEGILTPEVEKEVAKLRRVAARATDLKSVESEERLLNLFDELSNLQISSDKRDANATLGEIFKFRSHVYDASADGRISPEQRKYFLKQIETVKTTGLVEAKGKGEGSLINMFLGEKNMFNLFSSPDTPEQHGFRKVNAWLDDVNFSDSVEGKAKVSILNEMMIQVTAMRERGTDVTNDMVDKIVEQNFKKELIRQHPSFQDIPAKGVAKRLKSGKKVLVFPNGLTIPIK